MVRMKGGIATRMKAKGQGIKQQISEKAVARFIVVIVLSGY
jgi:hypothetical protein